MKELTLDEISLLEEMKSNCLKKGQYIDEKAKDKFNMLCHLEDFGIAYYELLDVIKEVRERLMKANIYRNYDDEEDDTHYTDLNIEEVLEILDKVDKENNND